MEDQPVNITEDQLSNRQPDRSNRAMRLIGGGALVGAAVLGFDAFVSSPSAADSASGHWKTTATTCPPNTTTTTESPTTTTSSSIPETTTSTTGEATATATSTTLPEVTTTTQAPATTTSTAPELVVAPPTKTTIPPTGTEQLAYTGSDSARQAEAAAGLVLLGSALVVSSKKGRVKRLVGHLKNTTD